MNIQIGQYDYYVSLDIVVLLEVIHSTAGKLEFDTDIYYICIFIITNG